MGKVSKSGLGFGLGLSPQGSITQSNLDNKVKQLISKEPQPFNSKNFSFDESKSKYDGYLLDLNHKDGGSKAKYLKDVLGYNKGDGQALHNAIGEAIDGELPNSVEQTKFGQKYTFNTKIRGKDGSYKSANVVVVVQNDNGKVTWRTITLYPGKKD